MLASHRSILQFVSAPAHGITQAPGIHRWSRKVPQLNPHRIHLSSNSEESTSMECETR
jgi:hypothetical protein